MNFEDLDNLWNHEITLFPESFQGVMLASSGHTDSTALFHLFCKFTKRKKNFFRGVIHVNYKLRGQDSENDQAFVCDLAKNEGLEAHVLDCGQIDGYSRENFSQDEARRIRYDYFQKFLNQGYVIATAHHQDDLAENVLFRLMRGAEVENLGGMKRYFEGIWRPILHVPKSEVQSYLQQEGIETRYDLSNDETKYTRNQIRHKVLKELEHIQPKAAERLVRLAQDTEELSSFARLQLDRLRKNAPYSVKDTLMLPFAVFKIFLGDALRKGDCTWQQTKEALAREAFERLRLEEAFRFQVHDGAILDSDGMNWKIDFVSKNERERNAHPLTRARNSLSFTTNLGPSMKSWHQLRHNEWWCVTNLNTSKSLNIEIKTGKLRDKVRLQGCAKDWQLKELYQQNRVMLSNGAILYLIGIDNEPTHLFDGESFLRPDHIGNLERINVDEFRIHVCANPEPD